MTPPAVLVDVDGTLVDSNYHHALAWWRAFRDVEHEVPVWRIHRHVGMGGDLLVEAVAGRAVEARAGDAVRDRWAARYDELIGEVRPFAGAADALERLRDAGRPVALVSSAPRAHLDRYVDLLGIRGLAAVETTADDAGSTKPAPDLVEVALSRLATGAAMMVGDSPWDCAAAARAGVPTVGLLCGGYGAAELRDAGAVRVEERLGPWVVDRAAAPLG